MSWLGPLGVTTLVLQDQDLLQEMAGYYSSASSDNGRESSPENLHNDALHHDVEEETMTEQEKHSAFFKLPVDIFKCVLDYLDRRDAWSLKNVCRGISRSKAVDELLYRYPMQLEEVRDLRMVDWRYKPVIGHERWNIFQDCINDSNRYYVHKLAMSHWCSIEDFKWIEENLPALTCLDLTAIKDFVWTPEETWTWKQLATACPQLFARIQELEVANWADYTAHSRVEYSYSYNDYRFKPKFRLSRRRDGGSVAMEIFPLCTRLITLGIRERYSGFHTWNEWEVHQRVCCLIDGVVNNCSKTLTKLRVHDYAPYRSLFSTDATGWENLRDVEIGLDSWMEDRRDRDVILGPIPYRITPGHHHRDEEEAFDDKSFDTCERNHMHVGQHVVQGVGASFEDLLQNLRIMTQKYPNTKIKPIKALNDIVLDPFHLVNVSRRRGSFFHTHQNWTMQQQQQQQQQQQNEPSPLADPVSSLEVQGSLRWLAERCHWRPVLAWDNMMCDVFPANLESSRSFLPKADILSRIRAMVETLKSLNIPIRLSIGDSTETCPSSGLDGSLYFGDYRCFVNEDDNKREVLAPTQARFNLSTIAHLVDELSIQYPVDVPGVAGWSRATTRTSSAEKALLERECRGWARFWKRYALQFKNLKKLTTTVPNDIYNNWGKSEEFRRLLESEQWDMLETDEDFNHDLNSIGGFYSFSLRALARKRPRMRFVQKVFFRQDTEELQLDMPDMTEEEREGREIPDDALPATAEETPVHRFWPAKPPSVERVKKRKQHDYSRRSAKRLRAE